MSVINHKRSNALDAVKKRNQKKIKQYRAAFPSDPTLSHMPKHFLEGQASTSSQEILSVNNDFLDDENEADRASVSSTENVIDNVNDVQAEYCNVENPMNFESSFENECSDSSHSDRDSDSDDDDINIEENYNDNEDAIEHNEPSFLGQDGIPLEVANVFGLKMNLIPNKNIKAIDHIISTIAMAIRHKLSYEATLDMLKWLKMSYKDSVFPTSKPALWKVLSRNKNSIIPHYYCKLCSGYLGQKSESTKKLTMQCPCKACGPNKLDTNLAYFLKLDLIGQIKQLLEIPNIYKLLQYKSMRMKKIEGALEDIYDGAEYQKLCSTGNFLDNSYNFSLSINTDGCQLAKSSSMSAWPLYVQINEFPLHLRKKHMLLAGIYVDSKHPLMNNYLRPFIDEVNYLFNNGIKWKPDANTEVTSKFVVVVGTFDLPARASITRMTQYNGKYGCLHCYATGLSCGPGKYTYPIEQAYGRLRTHVEMIADMTEAFEERKIIKGVKGFSSLISLPSFDICKGVVVESMHAVYLGVVKHHTALLLNTCNTPFYIGSPMNKTLIDNCLLSIRPPSRRSRAPRTIESYKQWKASEWRNWLGYAPICLSGIIPDRYVNHIAILAEAIHYLNSDAITTQQLDRAETLLKQYVTDFQNYFGIEKMTFNLHLLTHITETVRNWGPIWVHSAFVFESWNKKIIETVTSPHHRPDQIATRFLMNKFIESSICDNTSSAERQAFIKKMLKFPNLNDQHNIIVSASGKSEKRQPTEAEKQLLLEKEYNPEYLLCFKKIKVNGIEFTCSDQSATKFCNSSVSYGGGNFGKINCIAKFEHPNNDVYIIFVNQYETIEFSFNSNYIRKVELTNNMSMVTNFGDIMPAVHVIKDDIDYIFKLSNCWETD